jgi:hypothetical protein
MRAIQFVRDLERGVTLEECQSFLSTLQHVELIEEMFACPLITLFCLYYKKDCDLGPFLPWLLGPACGNRDIHTDPYEHGDPPLNCAARVGGHVRSLIDAKANIEHRVHLGRQRDWTLTPLYWALAYDKNEAAKVLIDAGARYEEQDVRGEVREFVEWRKVVRHKCCMMLAARQWATKSLFGTIDRNVVRYIAQLVWKGRWN